ncbi:MAG: hypothetical protein K8T91_09725 [Planctomycetes bacterium]|nr:hypothetical protein [Planctomycetota bacterium]
MSLLRFALLCGALAAVTGCEPPRVDTIPPNAESAKRMRLEIASKVGAPAEAAPTEAPKKTGWATLKGRIVVIGTPPSPGNESISKDPAVCQPGGHPVLKPTLVVDSANGGLANVALYALKLTGDNVHESAAGKSGDVVFDQKACVFLTHVATMSIGQKLKVLNSDPVSHNTLIAGRESNLNQNLGPGQSLLFEPKKPENLPAPVSCSIHPWMRAYVMPHENGYVTASGKDGSFEIANLPAGIELKIQLWHEMLQKNFKDVEIDGKKGSLAGGVLPLKLNNDETKQVEIKIPAAAFGK